jgi:YD repeat-containing protein
MRPRQLRTGGATLVSPLGRDEAKLQWQVAPLGMPFTSTISVLSGTSASWIDVITTLVVITQNVTGLTQTTPYHWRVRLLYRPDNRLGQTASRWVHVPWNGWAETDFRTPAESPVAGFSADPVSGAAPVQTTTVITCTYDPLNRLTGAEYLDGTFSAYQYDAAGRLVEAQSVTNALVYTYNGDGVRVAMAADGIETRWARYGRW